MIASAGVSPVPFVDPAKDSCGEGCTAETPAQGGMETDSAVTRMAKANVLPAYVRS